MRLVLGSLLGRARAVILVIAAVPVGLTACPARPAKPTPGEQPPLPPASGTAIGYLVDASGELKLRDDQLAKLKQIDTRLALRNSEIDAQLRQIERPRPEQELTPQQQKAGERAERYNNAPGASTIATNDSVKLRKMRDANDREALEKAFALFDSQQLAQAKKILGDRGVEIPGVKPQPPRSSDADGTPMPGLEP